MIFFSGFSGFLIDILRFTEKEKKNQTNVMITKVLIFLSFISVSLCFGVINFRKNYFIRHYLT